MWLLGRTYFLHVVLLSSSTFIPVHSFLPSKTLKVAYTFTGNVMSSEAPQKRVKLDSVTPLSDSSLSPMLVKKTSVEEIESLAKEMKANAQSNNLFTGTCQDFVHCVGFDF